MAVNSGYIQLHRQLKDHWLWKDEKKLKWWLDILFSVNHTDNKVLIKNTLIECKRGQSVKSIRTWAKEWKVSRKAVDCFFILLESEKMIEIESISFTSRLTVCKYDSYNKSGATKEPQRSHEGSTNNNDKNDNNENKEAEIGATSAPTISASSSKEFIPTPEQVASFKKFYDFIEQVAPRVNKLKEPVTCHQYLKLFGKEKSNIKKPFTKETMPFLERLLTDMENYEPLLKKSRSAYLTILKWKRMDEERVKGAGSTDQPVVNSQVEELKQLINQK